MLILEGAQAGLSWITTLRKWENHCKAFDYFNAGNIARYSAPAFRMTPALSTIVLKINAAIVYSGQARPDAGNLVPRRGLEPSLKQPYSINKTTCYDSDI